MQYDPHAYLTSRELAQQMTQKALRQADVVQNALWMIGATAMVLLVLALAQANDDARDARYRLQMAQRGCPIDQPLEPHQP